MLSKFTFKHISAPQTCGYILYPHNELVYGINCTDNWISIWRIRVVHETPSTGKFFFFKSCTKLCSCQFCCALSWNDRITADSWDDLYAILVEVNYFCFHDVVIRWIRLFKTPFIEHKKRNYIDVQLLSKLLKRLPLTLFIVNLFMFSFALKELHIILYFMYSAKMIMRVNVKVDRSDEPI